MKRLVVCAAAFLCLWAPGAVLADGPLGNVQHVIIVMQENHSFDNYFGVLPYAPKSPYHPGQPACSASDHLCVDGLACSKKRGVLTCANNDPDTDEIPVATVQPFHGPTRCTVPDLEHGWVGSHQELNFAHPNNALVNPLSDGFIQVNDEFEQIDTEETSTDDGTMSYYDATDIPFYYNLASKFAISDRQFASVVGPTIPNRFYTLAATSFGHLTTEDAIPPVGGYKPITGTIMDLLDANHVSWGDYFEDLPEATLFRLPDTHTLPVATFLLQARGIGAPLPQVVFIDPDFGLEGTTVEDDEHPPTDIQRGQAHVSDIVNAVRAGPYWKNSIVFITYDEHGGFYDHAQPPQAIQGAARTPDGIAPGQCADLSNPPASEQPGGGAECATNTLSKTDTSLLDAESLCAALAANPTGPFPASCASFDQFGIRVPFIAVSPFSKRAYVSHIARDHTAILGMIEDRFIGGSPRTALTGRDLNAPSLEEMFDFTNSPSLHTAVSSAGPPANDCTPIQPPGTHHDVF